MLRHSLRLCIRPFIVRLFIRFGQVIHLNQLALHVRLPHLNLLNAILVVTIQMRLFPSLKMIAPQDIALTTHDRVPLRIAQAFTLAINFDTTSRLEHLANRDLYLIDAFLQCSFFA
ncbi:unnamed protein product [Haemonchus placei]|uniref:Secreted protein n=1 Tax=Haemonchus placei TaxID=6290 RepID=A0A0N4X8H5_HAEPC|nr:unnamed protein product [Haemonchus placei]